ncbi:hypothetical protein BJX65DRAFT_315459 [Aspergillus insuetus]
MRALVLAIALVARIAAGAATGNAECTLCKVAVNDALEQVKQNETQEAIISALDGACTNVTNSSQEGHCQEFADKVGPVLVSALVGLVNADDVCTSAGLC